MDTSVSPMRVAMNVGAVTAILMLITALAGWQKISWFIFAIGICSGMKRHRSELGGCISYFRALQAGFQTAFYTSLIIAFAVYVMVTFKPALIDSTLEIVEQQVLSSGLSPEVILPQMKKTLTPVMLGLSAIFAYCAMGGIVSFILAFFVKKHLIFVKY